MTLTVESALQMRLVRSNHGSRIVSAMLLLTFVISLLLPIAQANLEVGFHHGSHLADLEFHGDSNDDKAPHVHCSPDISCMNLVMPSLEVIMESTAWNMDRFGLDGIHQSSVPNSVEPPPPRG